MRVSKLQDKTNQDKEISDQMVKSVKRRRKKAVKFPPIAWKENIVESIWLELMQWNLDSKVESRRVESSLTRLQRGSRK